MRKLPPDYVEKVYAGWLGKVIGVRHGAPIEGYNSYQKIEKVFGEITDYPVDYGRFAADDDTNGPIFFLRALQDYTHTKELTPEQIGHTWLNYAPQEHGFFWWGGYGKSTEHTAYLNMKNGIMPPRSGSIGQNGRVVAEQIGGQIFIDTWGLAVPGDEALAADYARKAACVSHGGNGIYGGMFVAACISAAFIKNSIDEIIASGLSVIPGDCEYAVMARDIISFHKNNSSDWKAAREYVYANYDYSRFGGVCPIITNAAIIVLSLLYGAGDFSQSINICNMCGSDTDCNVSNVGTILGVRNGLSGIDYGKWRKPINDFLACSSVVGSLNIMDIPWCAAYIAALGYRIAEEEPPERWRDILAGKAAKFHFEFPGSTHGFMVSSDMRSNLEYRLVHDTEYSHSGTGSLKISAQPIAPGHEIRIYHKTYYRPDDFHDSRYDPAFSPILYPGQTLSSFVMCPTGLDYELLAGLYVKDGNSGLDYTSDTVILRPGKWEELGFKIPYLEGACLSEAGLRLIPKTDVRTDRPVYEPLVAYIDSFDFSGGPHYKLDFSKERVEVWNILHMEVSQFTYLNGIWTLENGYLSGSCSDFAESYTGGYDWKDYMFEAVLAPQIGESHHVNFRVQGAVRSYALGLETGRLVLSKNKNGYKALKEIDYPWECKNEYAFTLRVQANTIEVLEGPKLLMTYTDTDNPYLYGQVGASVRNGSHCHYRDFKITGI